MSNISHTIGVVSDNDVKIINEIKVLNETLTQEYKAVKKELKTITDTFERDKQYINNKILEGIYCSKKDNSDENIKLKKHTEALESSLKNIANNYILIEKKVWKEQFNGNISTMNILLEKICDLEYNVRVLESEIIEKEEFYKNELLLKDSIK